jgi:hypothetical protein
VIAYDTFTAFPKIPRLKRGIIVTEKIDGTNAQIVVPDDPSLPLKAGSRNKFITPGSDNYGFARWVWDNGEELRKHLGPGQHFGEWWGAGIQRRYGLTSKRFSLFNTGRWPSDLHVSTGGLLHVVPVLYNGDWSPEAIEGCLVGLRANGSNAAPGFDNPEGVVVFHRASSSMYKILLENDELPKGLVPYAEKQNQANDAC